MHWLLVLVFLLSGPAYAQWASRTPSVMTQTAPDRVVISPGTGKDTLSDILSRRSYSPSSGGAILRDILTKPTSGPGSTGGDALSELLKKPFRPHEVTLKPAMVLEREVSRQAMARAAARALPLVGTALLVKDLWDAAGCKVQNGKAVCEGEYIEVPRSGEGVIRLEWSDANGRIEVLTTGEALAYGRQVFTRVGRENPTGTQYKVGACTVKSATPRWHPSPGKQFIDYQFACWTTELCDWDAGAQICRPRANQNELLFPGIYDPEPTRSTVKQCEFVLQPDGTCTFEPTPPQLEDRFQRPNLHPRLAPPLLENMDSWGIDYDTGPPTLTGPPSVREGRTETRQNPDGSVTTVDRTWDMRYSPGPTVNPWFEYVPKDTTTTWPPNTTPDPYVPPNPETGAPGTQPTPPGGSQSTVINNTWNNTTNVITCGMPGTPACAIDWSGMPQPAPAPAPEVKTCGLPDTPPCKIDESGTPTPEPSTAEQDSQGPFDALRACVTSPGSCFPALPSLDWAFTLPTSCGPITLGAFAPWLSSVDICPFQAVFHDVAGVLWVLAGIAAAVRLMFADSMG